MHNDDYYEMGEFEIKINQLIDEEVKKRIEQTVNKVEQLSKENEELIAELYDVRNELCTLKKDTEKKLEKALKEKELEVQRKFGGGFAVNDTVYYVDGEYKEIKCETCNGKGKIIVEIKNKKETVRCPHCEYGKITQCTYYPQESKINAMRFWVEKRDSWDTSSPAKLREDWDIEYYLERCGITRKTLYKTIEECQAVCDKKNKGEEVE